MAISLQHLDPLKYTQHACHVSPDRAWLEMNCYVDVWIELVHGCGFDPAAMMGMCLGVDFEGDQWTFFKPSHDTIRALYGIEVEELTPWKSVLENARVQVARGRVVLPEADSFYLPDTAATDYKRNHVKSTIGIVRFGDDFCDYFHTTGFYRVQGDDFVKLFEPGLMPMFTEYAKLDHAEHRPLETMRGIARDKLRETLKYRPRENPFIDFARHLRDDGVTKHGLAEWHKYAFVSVRQCGAAFELGGSHLEWLGPGFAELKSHAFGISAICKSLIMKGARAANSGRDFDVAEIVGTMRGHWDELMSGLDAQLR